MHTERQTEANITALHISRYSAKLGAINTDNIPYPVLALTNAPAEESGWAAAEAVSAAAPASATPVSCAFSSSSASSAPAFCARFDLICSRRAAGIATRIQEERPGAEQTAKSKRWIQVVLRYHGGNKTGESLVLVCRPFLVDYG